eukprot:1544261-Rhodomonas_salina.1
MKSSQPSLNGSQSQAGYGSEDTPNYTPTGQRMETIRSLYMNEQAYNPRHPAYQLPVSAVPMGQSPADSVPNSPHVGSHSNQEPEHLFPAQNGSPDSHQIERERERVHSNGTHVTPWTQSSLLGKITGGKSGGGGSSSGQIGFVTTKLYNSGGARNGEQDEDYERFCAEMGARLEKEEKEKRAGPVLDGERQELMRRDISLERPLSPRHPHAESERDQASNSKRELAGEEERESESERESARASPRWPSEEREGEWERERETEERGEREAEGRAERHGGGEGRIAPTSSLLSHRQLPSSSLRVPTPIFLRVPMILWLWYAMSGTYLAAWTTAAPKTQATKHRRRKTGGRVRATICLRSSYAMSGAEIAYAAISGCLRACYAMPGIEIAYAAICRRAC